MEFVVTRVDALETPNTLTDSAGKVFPMVTLRMDVISPSGQPEQLLLHFAPTHLETLLPNLTESTRQALLLSTAPEGRPH